MRSLFSILLALTALTTSHGATLTYEVAGFLSTSSNPSRWAAGTPFVLRFSYSTDTLQSANIFQDFQAPAVVTSGYFVIGSERVLTFSDQILFYSDDPTGFLSFNLFTSISVETEVPLNPTVDPESNIFLSLASPTAFLPDGRLFDDTISSTISPFSQFSFDHRDPPSAFGSGDVSYIRAIPEPTGVSLTLCGFAFLFCGRKLGRVAKHFDDGANKALVPTAGAVLSPMLSVTITRHPVSTLSPAPADGSA